MISVIKHKKILFFIILMLITTGSFLWYKEQKTTKEVPKKAKYVYMDNSVRDKNG